ncbi:TIGR02611 family protein [Curtobacterium sp. MCJR17_055]|uniref:TIGR02611 family protein n=1 Tax=unclassified Curtobacterium TaxID=257496 RepID=UPI000DA085BA|nr:MULTISPECIES: TIGR02611 family protein [unclassified Curtobacterium]PYY33257.1 TIGR02611 family protein [Curtobacterium sp. MCBD17_029]PYY36613.1 TIGR02611 family protein [Curtobacterium sp. MCPF17_046]PYY47478.1 TIGR02611 family protein [Curtobacterium sp. MCBD17_023]PYY53200.1 TIGR02611 family protein [Curtobacterium sp. MCJR17_055]PYY56355.1 TIGR02611 family protein [Curtobacterium sp. MCPF17_015]
MHGDPTEPPRSAGPDVGGPDADRAASGRTEQADGGRQRFQWFRDLRTWIHARPHVHLFYKVLVGIVGGLIVVVGLALVPLPGPGWLVVFIGLTVLASEFHFFHRIITWLRAKLHRFWDWAKHHAPSKRMRDAADKGKADVDAAHAEAHRNVGVPRPRGRTARPGL